jgi:iron(II)-dependent oxidoreductase
MGDNRDSDANPCHQITLPTYKIGRYPVTNNQYRRFVEKTKRKWGAPDGFRLEKANSPAVLITWHDANDYCQWLTEEWRRTGKITTKEMVHLPSEAHWEKAARGEDKRGYPWGDDWNLTYCNTNELGLNQTTPVGIFPSGTSPYGCLDMVGNVWEWTSTLWGLSISEPIKYPYDPNDGREGESVNDKIPRVLRGSSWLDDRSVARCAFRNRSSPFSWDDYFGFRVAVSTISSTI